MHRAPLRRRAGAALRPAARHRPRPHASPRATPIPRHWALLASWDTAHQAAAFESRPTDRQLGRPQRRALAAARCGRCPRSGPWSGASPVRAAARGVTRARLRRVAPVRRPDPSPAGRRARRSRSGEPCRRSPPPSPTARDCASPAASARRRSACRRPSASGTTWQPPQRSPTDCPAHRAVIERTAETGWYAEQLFARFAVIDASGAVDGRDPLGMRERCRWTARLSGTGEIRLERWAPAQINARMTDVMRVYRRAFLDVHEAHPGPCRDRAHRPRPQPPAPAGAARRRGARRRPARRHRLRPTRRSRASGGTTSWSRPSAPRWRDASSPTTGSPAASRSSNCTCCRPIRADGIGRDVLRLLLADSARADGRAVRAGTRRQPARRLYTAEGFIPLLSRLPLSRRPDALRGARQTPPALMTQAGRWTSS